MGFYISSMSGTELKNTRFQPGTLQERQYQTAPNYNYKWTDLHCEASRGNIERLQALLRIAGEDQINQKDYYGKSPLYWAAYKGQRACIELLLEHGADANSQCKHGATPLHAVIGLFPDCALLLIQNGADVDLPDNWGVTPMYLAACSGQLDCLRLLVLSGAKITYRNKNTGEAPKQLASKTTFLSWIDGYQKNPLSLKQTCRLKIRELIGYRKLHAIRTLDVPQSLKSYLMFEDLTLCISASEVISV
ncbi:ankyrin repeat and SOCS box protein 13-like [Chiloscyllium plagiosum]|uniref:ankyrin repeat and SOCS box protein 13-like n=1 Tax=Chiloscyllium plagiosum TaxID=36176 RepID=UPI001CB833C8|nr:ankyrin repeat and SOCS box protein 13-like [Chiloscyllium plagiosum]XP_043564512.1 ankyrin repeat and SOCS box protein 13-like [Chiloscyllium plagiosum]